MHYLLTDGPSHRDLADFPELPAVTGDDRDDGDDGISTLFIDKAEMSCRGGLIAELGEPSRCCSVELTYTMRGLMEGSRGVLLC